MNPAGDSDDAVAFAAVAKDYVVDWRGARHAALRGVSFTVRRGTVCALVGPNGSGKSTTLKLAAGLTCPTAGTCTVRGRIGYLPESPGLPGYLTARALLAELAALDGGAAVVRRETVARAMAQAGLADAADRRVGELSQGMRQRLGLAQALLGEPAVLLLDEPAAGLDPRAAAQLAAVIAAQRAAGRTVVLSSHFLPQVAELADQVVLLERGAALFVGTRADVAARGGLERIYLEETAR